MMDTKEHLSVAEIEHDAQDTTKYNKHINDVIEDAEIEAELEAEKKIRSKNSRVFSISMIGMALLTLVYLQINRQPAPTTIPDDEIAEVVNNPLEMAEKKVATAEEKLAKQVPIVKDGSQIPVPKAKVTEKIITPDKTQIAAKKSPTQKPASPSKIQKKSETPKLKSIVKPKPEVKTTARPLAPTKTNSRFFIQIGAYSVRKNAEASMKKLQSKGFSSLIQVKAQDNVQQIVTVGKFSNKNAGSEQLKNLKNKGFPSTWVENKDKTFSLQVGHFNTMGKAQKFQDSLSLKGFLSEVHQGKAKTETYLVQLGVFPTKEKATLVQEKLVRAGYPNTFIR